MKNLTELSSGFNASRRGILIVGGAALAAAMILPGLATAAESPRQKIKGSNVSMQGVTFMNNNIRMAGNLYFPEGFDATRKYPSIVVIHPGGGVKEQTAGVYAERLAGEGFVTLAFDASHQGASGGEPRFLDDPMRRVGDIYSAVDYLTTLAYVNNERIGALGICAGSGAAVKASSSDRRIRAVGTVSAVDVGAATRKGWEGKGPVSDELAMLNSVAKQRTAESAGAPKITVPYVPAVGDTSAPKDLQEAADYYLTPRGQHPNAPNKLLMTSLSYMASFTGFDMADTMLTQPLVIIAGSKAGSLWHSTELYDKAASADKKLIIVEGATHMDLYDGKGVDTAMTSLAPFFKAKIA
ncbi:alpha/beta hydrolase [Pantoea sp. B9002]|nr:alpha/beta hydrolase [Pantoea sp. B9002]